MKKLLLIVIGAIVVLAVLSPKPPKTVKTPKEVTATELSNEFKANAVKAEEDNKAFILHVTGPVRSIETSLFGSTPMVVLETGDRFEGVRLHVGDADKVSTLVLYEEITAVCDKAENGILEVHLSNCVIK